MSVKCNKEKCNKEKCNKVKCNKGGCAYTDRGLNVLLQVVLEEETITLKVLF